MIPVCICVALVVLMCACEGVCVAVYGFNSVQIAVILQLRHMNETKILSLQISRQIRFYFLAEQENSLK
jgi:hypothetical protein